MNNRAEYYGIKRATAGLANWSTAQILVPAVAGKCIYICDIVASKISGGGEFRWFDAGDEIWRTYPNTSGNNTHIMHFTAPIRITAGNAFKLQLDDTDTHWSVLVTYYYA